MNNNIDPVEEAPVKNDSEPDIPPAVEYDAVADSVSELDSDVIGDGTRPVKGPK